jgi:pilus assembly protein CpaB
MANSRATIMIGISVVIGLAAVFVAAQWVGKQTAMATEKVVVAGKDLDLGSRLSPQVLQLVDWPKSSVVKGAFSDPKLLDTRVLNTSVLRGEPILEAKLAPLGAKGGLSAVIGEGKRAMTVKVNEVIGVAGFALPGNRVDIMVSAQDEQNKPISKIVLEQILVLAVAQEASRDETKPKVVSAVTLEVTPEQAERLDLARSVGTLSLVLRSQTDRAPVTTMGVRRADLLKGSAPEASPPAPVQVAAAAAAKEPAKAAKPPARVAPKKASPVAEQPKVEIIRGAARSSMVVSDTP